MNEDVTSIIIVLGSPNDDFGNLSSMALERCARAVGVFQEDPTSLILPTGGWGKHFNTTDTAHGDYVRRELVNRGLPGTVFLACTQSTNTIEDAALSRPILDEYPNAQLTIVTSDFHEARARFIFEQEFPGRDIAFSVSVTNLTAEESAQRKAHERQALGKLKQAAQQEDQGDL